MKLTNTPGELKQFYRDKLAKQVLSDRYIKLKVDKEFDIKENLQKNSTKVCCKINLTGSNVDSAMFIEGSGRGPVDAFFSSLISQLSKQFCSLGTLRFSEFAISADLDRSSPNDAGSDALVEATLVVTNNLGNQFVFRDRSHSMNCAAVDVVLQAVQHFINAEEAVITLHHAIVNAKSRNRGDLIDTYTMQLSELVESSSYKEAIAENIYTPEDYED